MTLDDAAVKRAVTALHDQWFCGCERGVDSEHHPLDREEWEKAARIALTAALAGVE